MWLNLGILIFISFLRLDKEPNNLSSGFFFCSCSLEFFFKSKNKWLGEKNKTAFRIPDQ
jgi:hypothetical protein